MIQMMLHVFLLLSYWSVYSFNMFQPTPTRSMIGDHIPKKSARKPAKSYSSKISQKQTLTRRDKQPITTTGPQYLFVVTLAQGV